MSPRRPSQSAPVAPPVDTQHPTVLVVDDESANLASIEAILEPLEVDVVTASSGRDALRVLLEHDVAVIVLDVRMPGMDGYETAQLIKQRPRTQHVPIIFLTALANDREEARSGYEAGGVDFIPKPVEPVVLRAKVANFAELQASRMQVELQARQLREAAADAAERELLAERERGLRQFRDLAEVLPAMVFALDETGRVTYRSPQWISYTGLAEPIRAMGEHAWDMIHPADRLEAERMWDQLRDEPEAFPDGRGELLVRLRRHDGAYLWHSITIAARQEGTEALGFVGSAREVDTRRRTETGQRVLSDAGAVLVSSERIEDTLTRVAELAVPSMVDWCTIDLAEADGELRRVAIRVDGSIAPADVERLSANLSIERADSLARRVIEPDGPVRLLLRPDGMPVVDDEAALDDGPGRRPDAMLVPLIARGERIGVLSVALAALGRLLGPPERSFAIALATRLSSAVDAARLYRRAQERAQAAEVLAAIADGVALVDQRGIVRLWNPAAELITGVAATDIVGRRAGDVLQDWNALMERIPVASPGARGASVTAPLAAASGAELWLSVSAVDFELGVAYAFRDLTEERAVERMKSDFVATVSHELRTPLASIYGAAVTLQREDMELDDDLQNQLLDIIGQQSQQLAAIVDDVLTASRLDAATGQVETTAVDAERIVGEIAAASRSRTEAHEIEVCVDGELTPVAADPGHLRQVLDNLLDNAIKYSPQGGSIRVELAADERTVTFRVRDEGIGIAPSEHRRIFEKFYRVDADMAGGVGGTGLGLFIVRELVRRMGGRIDVQSTPGEGSTFTLRLPVARDAAPSTAGVAVASDAAGA